MRRWRRASDRGHRPPRGRRAAFACLMVLLAAGVRLPAQARAQAPDHHARLFPPLDLGLLEAPDRDLWQKPEFIMDELGIADGSVVADIGAGGGWFTMYLARRVGPNGLVYAEDIQRQMIEVIDRRVTQEGLHNVQTILGTPDDPRLPDGALDAVLIVDAYHEIENPVALLRHVARALKPQGRVGIVDFTAGGGGPGPAANDRVAPATIIRTAAEAGLGLLKQESVPPYEFLIVLERRSANVTPR
ncbi:MAG TPA: methyltransferase domain-containing protein [Vicinamibacterales bacterium]|nr:methyltransferase domain-containing protein [Vicinamibacterales bacterium]